MSKISLCLAWALGVGFCASSAQAQHKISKCGYDLAIQRIEKTYAGFKQYQDESYRESQQQITAHKGTATLLRIPVVFHIVYNTPQQNIPDSLIYSQLDVLNRAYRKTHSDTGNTRPPFKALSQDAEIEFYLAAKDPQGHSTTGITRTFTPLPAFGDIVDLFLGSFDSLERVKYTALGGHDAWPTNQYLNIWVADLSDQSLSSLPFLLGYATPPMNPLPPNWPLGSLPPLKDGVVLQYQTIGRFNPHAADLQGMASAGRVAVHEIGHYLGLRHIGGDTDSCGISSDGIHDTPTMLQSDQSDMSCQNVLQNSCVVGGSSDTLDMWENYMDYSNDLCQTMFTSGQVAHMRYILNSRRNTLSLETATMANRISIYPNPASNSIYIDYPHPITSLVITNMLGQHIDIIPGTAIVNGKLNLESLTTGNYIITLTNRKGERLAQRLTINR